MVCIYCGSATYVLNSRSAKGSPAVWRRRRCSKCQTVLTTRERPDLSLLIRVKDKEGTLQPFSEDKLLLSVHRCLTHRKDALEASGALSETIVRHLTSEVSDNSIDKAVIAKTAYKVITRFDKTAGIFYKAHHRLE